MKCRLGPHRWMHWKPGRFEQKRVNFEDHYWHSRCQCFTFQEHILSLVRVTPTLALHGARSVLMKPSWAQRLSPVMGMSVSHIDTVDLVCFRTANFAVKFQSLNVSWLVDLPEDVAVLDSEPVSCFQCRVHHSE